MAQAIIKFTKKQKWVSVLDDNIIETSIIDIKPKAFIKFYIKQDCNINKGFRRPNKTIDEIDFNVSLQGL